MELGAIQRRKRAQHMSDHGMQSMQKQERELGYNLPAAMPVLHH
jgi:hypothetical protein